MNLKLSEAQEMLQREARRFFGQHVPIERVHAILEAPDGLDCELWRAIAEMGWLGIIIPEQYGGAGGTFLDLVVLLEEMGRARVPGPYFATVLLGAMPIVDHGTAEQKSTFLPAIASGKNIISLALVEGSGRYDPQCIRAAASRARSGYVLSGTKLFVPYGLAAGTLLCAARMDEEPGAGIALFLVDAGQEGVVRSAMQTMTHECYATVALSGAAAEERGRLTPAGQGWPEVERTLLKGAVGRCAVATGGARHILDITVAYAKERVQFDRPIGSFQAIQHYCADMLTAVDSSRIITYYAASKIAAGQPYEMEAAMAKAWCGDAYRRVTGLGHQVHGGVGLIVEHELHLYTQDAWATGAVLGDTGYHHEIIARALEQRDALG